MTERFAHRYAVLAILLLVSGFQGIISGFTLTFFPMLMEHAGVATEFIGLGNSAQMGAIIAVTLVLPYFLHTLRLPALYAGSCLIGAVAVLVLSHTTDNLKLHILLRLLMGSCVSVMYIVLEYWLNATVDPNLRGKVLGCYGMAIVTGMGAGPLLIGETGIGGFAPFMLGAALFLVCAVISLLARKGAPTGHLDAEPPRGNPLRFLRLAPALALAGLLHGIVESGMYSFLPVYGMREGLSEHQAATLLTCVFWGAIALQLILGWLADRWTAMNTLRLAAFINAGGALLLPVLLPDAGNMLWVYMLIWGGTIPTIYTLTSTCIGHRYRDEKLANAILTFVLMYGLGGLIGPYITGQVIAHITTHGLPVIMVLAYGICFATLLFSREPKHSKESL